MVQTTLVISKQFILLLCGGLVPLAVWSHWPSHQDLGRTVLPVCPLMARRSQTFNQEIPVSAFGLASFFRVPFTLPILPQRFGVVHAMVGHFLHTETTVGSHNFNHCHMTISLVLLTQSCEDFCN